VTAHPVVSYALERREARRAMRAALPELSDAELSLLHVLVKHSVAHAQSNLDAVRQEMASRRASESTDTTERIPA